MVVIFSFFMLVIFGDNALLELNRVKRERNILIKKNEDLCGRRLHVYRDRTGEA